MQETGNCRGKTFSFSKSETEQEIGETTSFFIHFMTQSKIETEIERKRRGRKRNRKTERGELMYRFKSYVQTTI